MKHQMASLSPDDIKALAAFYAARARSERTCAAAAGLAAWLWRRPQRWFLFGIPIGGLCLPSSSAIGLTGRFIGGLKYAETDSFCTSCHEMNSLFRN